MTPATKLRLGLSRLRARGYSFRQAFGPAVNNALRDEGVHTAVFYRQVFNEQRPIWAVSYSRLPWPVKDRPSLDAELIDDERSRVAGRTRPESVLA